MTYPELPDSIELDAQQKRRLIAAVKTVLTRLHEAGFVREADYTKVIGRPTLLHAFITAYRQNPELAEDLVVDAKGRPVRDADTPLVCGATLAQVMQMLIFTCAKRLFTEVDTKIAAKQTQSAAKSGGGGLFRRKAEPAPVKSGVTDAERRLADLRPLLAFDWQLPLLRLYYVFFDRQQLAELGRDLLLLRTPESLEAVATCDVNQMRKVRQVLRQDFSAMLAAKPQAMRGIAYWDPQKYPLMVEALGAKVWDFYARDIDFLDFCADLEPERIQVLGPLMATIAAESIRAFDRVSPEKMKLLLSGLAVEIGPDFVLLMNEPGFGRHALPSIVQSFAGLDVEPEQFREVVRLKGAALKSSLAGLIEKRRAARAAPGDE
ncbi:hypothetical protein [Telmatospirillum sp. J64-1]|uniref:hypothetical protein n=1 Tax=Telmatospirillum sp. J64-1 TaxID=2502183 RepID=UPI00115F343D|nr:hypothetical protein [Telmatospirillum sp. J64-1]